MKNCDLTSAITEFNQLIFSLNNKRDEQNLYARPFPVIQQADGSDEGTVHQLFQALEGVNKLHLSGEAVDLLLKIQSDLSELDVYFDATNSSLEKQLKKIDQEIKSAKEVFKLTIYPAVADFKFTQVIRVTKNKMPEDMKNKTAILYKNLGFTHATFGSWSDCVFIRDGQANKNTLQLISDEYHRLSDNLFPELMDSLKFETLSTDDVFQMIEIYESKIQ